MIEVGLLRRGLRTGRVAIFALCFLAACGGDSERTIRVTPTAIPGTATPTEVPEETATAAATRTGTIEPTDTPAADDTPTRTRTAATSPTSTRTVASGTPTLTPTGMPTGTVAATATPTPVGIQVRGSVEQIYLTDCDPGAEFELRDPSGAVIDTGTADARGSLVWRGLAPGEGYTVAPRPQAGVAGLSEVYGPVAVSGLYEHPDPAIYEDQEIQPGYGYLRTRDGTLLAINVLLPGPIENGPYPTLIEYSGYDPANPAVTQPGVLIGPIIGFATVGVNIRGMGCSGGAFNFFEPAQSTDGYDVVEVIARQSWVKGNKVGMIGISYPGIAQLFTARTQPPHLAAIAPLSVIADTGRGTLYPGGILNNGFAVDWAAERQHDAMAGGQRWSQKRMDEGDQVCIDNQKLKDQATDLFQQIEDNPFYTDEVGAPLSPATFVDRINVPVFLSGAWQDEQTGPYFATMLDRFTGTDKIHFTMTNGGHSDPLGPAVFTRWYEFLSFYVREEVPVLPAAAVVILQVLADDIFGVPGITGEADRFTGLSYEEALAMFEAEPRVRILFDNGAGDPSTPGSPVPGFEESFDAWPIPEIDPLILYFEADGRLSPDAPSGDGEDSYVFDPTRSQITNLSGGSGAAWKALPNWRWQPITDDTAVAYETDPLAEDLVTAGSGGVDLWLKSTAADTDIQVTLSEVRPDGVEVYIQNGWLRASRRALDEAESTVLRPVATQREADAAELPAGELSLVRVEIMPFAHAFRAGSRVRISVESPGGSRVLWKFAVLQPDGEVINTVSRSAAYPSRLVLPRVPGIDIPTAAPPCPSLRAQPCVVPAP